jgi:hypothetical protein
MTPFSLETTLAASTEQAFVTYRDRLLDLAVYLPNVESIARLSREEREDGRVLQVCRWQARSRQVPLLARPFVRREHLGWIDHAEWRLGELVCDWRFEFPSVPGAVRCEGRNQFLPDPQGCRFVVSGELSVNLGAVPGVPGFALGLAPTVERFALNHVQPNLAAVAAALARLL